MDYFKHAWFYGISMIDGTRQHNFSILNFSKKMIIIGGTGYTEIKKSIFSVILFYHTIKMFCLYCSKNVGEKEGIQLFSLVFQEQEKQLFLESK